MQTPLDDYDPDTSQPKASSSKMSHARTAGKGKSPLHIALETVLAVERAKVLTGPSDCVGVLVYNVDSSKAPVIKLPASLGGLLLENFGEGTVLFQPMRQISAEEIKRIKDFVEEANEELGKQSDKLAAGERRSQPSTISQQFPPLSVESPIDVADVFECCNHVFRDLGKTIIGAKRVLLITNNDRPELELGQGDRDLSIDPREPARTRFRDLASFGVSVMPFFIPQPGKDFDDERYWNDVLDRPDPEEGDGDADVDDDANGGAMNLHRNNKVIAADGLDKLQSLMEERLLRSGTKRALFRVPLRLGGGIEIGVTGYSLIASVQRPTYKYYDMSRRQPEEVKVKTSFTSAMTGAALEPGQIGFAYSFGKSDAPTSLQDNYWAEDKKEGAGTEEEEQEEEDDDDDDVAAAAQSKGGKSAPPTIRTRITFTESEIRQFKTLDLEPQIKILGFQDPSALRFEHNVKHSVFVYPDESAFVGSTRTFAALLAVCAKRNRHAVALALLRRNATPIYCCLIPQPETYGEDGSQDKPPGFHLVPLPFADDIRDRPDKIDPTFAKCTEEQKVAMTEVTKKLRLRGNGYQSQSYPNPGECCTSSVESKCVGADAPLFSSALQYFYAKLQSLAFAEDSFDPNQTEDKTLPQVDKMHQVREKPGPGMHTEGGPLIPFAFLLRRSAARP